MQLSFFITDIDECEQNNTICTNICINKIGSYSCSCDEGFEFDEDSYNCTKLQEEPPDFLPVNTVMVILAIAILILAGW